jgi:lipopolysaccharide heptosyltransferase II
MVVKKLAFDTVKHNPYIDEIEVYNSSWTIPKIEGHTKQGIVDFIRFVLKLRKEKYDVAFDLKGDFRNILIMYLSGAKRRIGYGNRGGSFMLTDVVNYNAEEHEIDKNLSLLKPLNISSTFQEPEIFFPKEDEDVVRSILREMGIQKTKVMIGIHAGGASFYKRWPEEKFAKLIKLLKREGEAQILIFGGHYERDIISKIRKKIRENGVFIMPELTLCQMASAFARCQAVICNDSGPMHVAIAAKTPVVAIFGPTFADRFGPKDLKRNRVVCSRMDCSPCWNPDTSIGCRERTCLNNVTVDEVFEAVKEAVQS